MTRKLSSSRFCRACLISPNLTGTMCLTAPRLVLESPFHYSPCDYISGSCLWCLGKHDYSQHAVFSRLWSLGCCRWRWIRGIQLCRCSIIHGSTWVHHGRIRWEHACKQIWCWRFVCISQDDGMSENDNQLSVAGKIKKHFNTGPKLSNTSAGVSVITVSSRTVSGSGAEGCRAFRWFCFITAPLNGKNICFLNGLHICLLLLHANNFCMSVLTFVAALERQQKYQQNHPFCLA